MRHQALAIGVLVALALGCTQPALAAPPVVLGQGPLNAGVRPLNAGEGPVNAATAGPLCYQMTSAPWYPGRTAEREAGPIPCSQCSSAPGVLRRCDAAGNCQDIPTTRRCVPVSEMPQVRRSQPAD
jgi:hypothetical protein